MDKGGLGLPKFVEDVKILQRTSYLAKVLLLTVSVW